MRYFYILAAIALMVYAAITWMSDREATPPTPLGNTQDEEPVIMAEVKVDHPKPNALVASPLIVTGEARGTWFFEASLPLKLIDGEGNVIAEGPAQAQGEWMTEEFVPFAASLRFIRTPKTDTGTLIVAKDNPSGLPEHDKSIEIPVRFK